MATNQKNNGVTLQLGNTEQTDIKFMLGATKGTTSRTIQFNFQPTMLCAKTMMPDLTLKPALDPAFPPKTNMGEILNASSFTRYQICTGQGCGAGASTTAGAGAGSGAAATTSAGAPAPATTPTQPR